MSSMTIYRISLGISILLSIAAFFTLLGSIAPLAKGIGRESWVALMPWTPLILVALAGLNCTLRANLIVRKRRA